MVGEGQAREPLQGVAKTALGAARMRAEESRRSDRLFEDPYAQAFVDAAPEATPVARPRDGELADLGAALGEHVALRTRFFDDRLLDACAAGVGQVVLLAAGLDTRAFRLTWPAGVRLFELDLPEVLAFKARVLQRVGAVPGCERVPVTVDLRNDWRSSLSAAGHDGGQPTAWLVEGLLVYLTAEEAARVLDDVGGASAPGSRLAFEHGAAASRLLADRAGDAPTLRGVTAMWKGGLGADTPNWLAEHGWATQIHDRAVLAAALGRPTDNTSGSGFITATRR